MATQARFFFEMTSQLTPETVNEAGVSKPALSQMR
jgi:hypothetical protein